MNLSFARTDWIQPALLTKCQFYKLDHINPRAIDIDGGVVSILKENIDERDLAPAGARSKGEKPWWKKVLGG